MSSKVSRRARGNPGRGASSRKASTRTSQRDITDGLAATPLETLSKPGDVPGESVEIKEFQYVASYNWKDSQRPTIVVPGSPRQWRDREIPYSVPKDHGINFIDQNGYRMPKMSLLPLFRAADFVAENSQAASVDWKTIDFVTDRNNLRKLLRWIHGKSNAGRDFRIDMQLAGKQTVLLSRWEVRTKVNSSNQVSYGYSFEHESADLAKGCEGTTGHHRIVQYDFDGLKMVVRFEVDACIPAQGDVDILADALSGLDVASGSTKHHSKQSSSTRNADVMIVRGGSQVAHDAIMEMTTRSQKTLSQFDWVDAYPQLYLSQTPHHFLAVHDGTGKFISITKRELGSPDMKGFDDDAQARFRKLRRVLHTLQELVMKHGLRGRLSLVFRASTRSLEVFKRSRQDSLLPEDVMKRFGI